MRAKAVRNKAQSGSQTFNQSFIQSIFMQRLKKVKHKHNKAKNNFMLALSAAAGVTVTQACSPGASLGMDNRKPSIFGKLKKRALGLENKAKAWIGSGGDQNNGHRTGDPDVADGQLNFDLKECDLEWLLSHELEIALRVYHQVQTQIAAQGALSESAMTAELVAANARRSSSISAALRIGNEDGLSLVTAVLFKKPLITAVPPTAQETPENNDLHAASRFQYVLEWVQEHLKASDLLDISKEVGSLQQNGKISAELCCKCTWLLTNLNSAKLNPDPEVVGFPASAVAGGPVQETLFPPTQAEPNSRLQQSPVFVAELKQRLADQQTCPANPLGSTPKSPLPIGTGQNPMSGAQERKEANPNPSGAGRVGYDNLGGLPRLVATDEGGNNPPSSALNSEIPPGYTRPVGNPRPVATDEGGNNPNSSASKSGIPLGYAHPAGPPRPVATEEGGNNPNSSASKSDKIPLGYTRLRGGLPRPVATEEGGNPNSSVSGLGLSSTCGSAGPPPLSTQREDNSSPATAVGKQLHDELTAFFARRKRTNR